MSIPYYARRSFWDLCELGSIVVAGIAAFVALFLTDPVKSILAVVGISGTVLVGVSRYRVKCIDSHEKRAMEAAANAVRLRNTFQAQRMVKGILDVFSTRYFRKVEPGSHHRHRVTLFVCDDGGGSANIGKHLRIFARSGLHEDSSRTWLIDGNDIKKCRGIAGKIWFQGTRGWKEAACDWPEDGDTTKKALYAGSLDVTVEEVEPLNVKSRYFVGMPVRVGRKKWGVLLLDSLDPGSITPERFQDQLLNQYTAIICSALEGVDP